MGRLLYVFGGSVLVCEVFLRAGWLAALLKYTIDGFLAWCSGALQVLKKGVVQLMRYATYEVCAHLFASKFLFAKVDSYGEI